jgi:hypothetical protein
MAQAAPIQDRFVLVVKHQIKAISTMIDNANDEGLTEKTSNDVDMILNLITAMETNNQQSKLVEMFIAKSEFWPVIESKDINALEKSFPKMFGGLPIDQSTLSEPIRVYLAEKSKASKKAPVIGDKHMDAMWVNLDKLVKASIIYDSENKSKFRVLHNLDKYYTKYSIKPSDN